MKSTEHWIALAAAMIFVAMQNRDKPLLAQIGIAGVSGGLGHSLSQEFAARFTFFGPLGWTVILTAFGYAGLVIALSLITDRESIKEIAIRWLGGSKK